ncbi:neuronal acetylcholine receptor subunit alpha-9-like [Rhopilema esculentum]|uniref:neuronal acetylcholine receptor subunit alpha-9-like n=1 Tax=Rhopilema esculentum TaxID=499914 RepID=UPI0031DB00B6|eukprot:gene13110-3897_t
MKSANEMTCSCVLVFILIGVLAMTAAADEPKSNDTLDYEIMLVEKLTKNYKNVGRPVHSNKEPVLVYYDLKINKLEKLVTVNQLLILHTFVMMVWKDPHLRWNETEFNGTDIITLKSSSIWTPDIMLYNTAEDQNKSPQDTYKAPVNVFHNGTVVWYVPVVWKSSCEVDITWFPVDTQVCKLVFASLSYTKSRLRLLFHEVPEQMHENKGHHHVTNGEWEYKGMAASNTEKHYDCCHEPVQQLIYELKIKRKPLFFLLYMMFPVCAVVFLSLLSFLIPAASGERIGFGVTILLTMGVYLMVISEDLPKTAHRAPLIGVLYVTLFYIMIIAYVASTINVSLSRKETKPPKFLLRLARSQKLPSRNGSSLITRMRTASMRTYVERKKSSIQKPVLETDGKMFCEDEEFFDLEKCPMKNEKPSNGGKYFAPMEKILDESAIAEKNNENWRRIAAYLDKVFLWVFLVLIIFSCAIIILALEIMHG